MGGIGALWAWIVGARSPEQPGYEAIERAALHELKDRGFEFIGANGVWWGTLAGACPIDSAHLDEMGAKIAATREWARSLPDRRAARAYDGWLDYFQRGVAEARTELVQRTIERGQATHRARRLAEDAETAAARAAIPKPHA